MPVPRFYRVLRGQRGTAAKTKFLSHLEGLDSTPAIGSRGARPASNVLYVKPFGVDLGTTMLLQTSATIDAYNLLKSAVSSARVKDTLPASTNGLKLRSSKAARVSATTGVTGSGVEKVSKLTGLHYASYGGKSYSCPFGQGAAGEKELDAFEAIFVALPAATYKRIHLIEEKI